MYWWFINTVCHKIHYFRERGGEGGERGGGEGGERGRGGGGRGRGGEGGGRGGDARVLTLVNQGRSRWVLCPHTSLGGTFTSPAFLQKSHRYPWTFMHHPHLAACLKLSLQGVEKPGIVFDAGFPTSVANLATLSLDLATFQTPLATFFFKSA